MGIIGEALMQADSFVVDGLLRNDVSLADGKELLKHIQILVAYCDTHSPKDEIPQPILDSVYAINSLHKKIIN
jgi:hypothetical protein